MDRLPKHLKEDPHLRPQFISQKSLDEIAHIVHLWLNGVAGEMGQDAKKVLEAAGRTEAELAKETWAKKLHPETNMSEYYYLMGYTDLTSRRAAAEQELTAMQISVESSVLFGYERSVEPDISHLDD